MVVLDAAIFPIEGDIMSKKYVGQTRTNRNGYEYVVKTFNQFTNRYTVYFPETYITKDVSEGVVRDNTVSEKPLFKSPTASLRARITTLYHSMTHRLVNHPSYKDVSLNPRWETLEGFRSTIHLVKGYDLWAESMGYSLDKDIKGMNAYGPDSCVFVTRQENSKHQPRKGNNRRIKSRSKVERSKVIEDSIFGKHPEYNNIKTKWESIDAQFEAWAKRWVVWE